VLGDIETFALPVSAAVRLRLPAALVNLNRGLHSMRGDEHAAQRRALAGILGAATGAQADVVRAAVDDVTRGWRSGGKVALLDGMRQLAARISAGVLFGDDHARHAPLAALLHTYFQLRREIAAVRDAAGAAERDALVAVGSALDAELRRYVRGARKGAGDGVLGRLAAATDLDAAAVVAHSNVLFVSSTEPIAVALTWILVILSQLPELRRELRDEGAAGAAGADRLLDRVVLEAMRLLPPNAMMSRITTRATRALGAALPAQTEVVLCPFLAHRDPVCFAGPDRFAPERWRAARPAPYQYLPYGGGGHACVGRGLAHHLITTALACLLDRFDVTLAGDLAIDWRIHIMLMPRVDPVVRVQRAGARGRHRPGRLGGPVGALLDLPS
jgi:cytochrome P450